MSDKISYDYFYGGESEQFSYYRIPRLLVIGEQFKRVSTDAKLLYGLLLDRMGLSAKNGWYDDQGRVYIYYPLDEIQEALCCGHDKATKLLVELDTGKGIGLIERVRQGQGKPTKIYVKRFATRAVPPPPPQKEHPRLLNHRIADCGKPAAQTAVFPQSRVRESRSQECGKTAASYNNIIYPENIYTDPSIHPSEPPTRLMDRYECREEVKACIEYHRLLEQHTREDVDEVVELITDVLSSTRETFRIGGEELPISTVKKRFWQLEQSHIEYVFERMKNNTTKIRNIRGYLLTALYNAPATIGHYYQAEVQHEYGQLFEAGAQIHCAG